MGPVDRGHDRQAFEGWTSPAPAETAPTSGRQRPSRSWPGRSRPSMSGGFVDDRDGYEEEGAAASKRSRRGVSYRQR